MKDFCLLPSYDKRMTHVLDGCKVVGLAKGPGEMCVSGGKVSQAVVATHAAPFLSEKQMKPLWSEKEGAGFYFFLLSSHIREQAAITAYR